MQAASIILIVATLVSAQQFQNGSKTCHLPPYPRDGYYEVAGNPSARPGDDLEYAAINVTCFHGTNSVGSNNVICVNGEWSAAKVHCERLCYLPKQSSVQYVCIHPGSTGMQVCKENEPGGSIARPRCRPYSYFPVQLPEMTCDKGVWDYVAICLPGCGQVIPRGENSDQRGEVPWQVGIYYKGSNPYMRICAGSIVSKDVVISAAACFWDDVASQVRPASDYTVAAGKLYRSWTHNQDTNAQKRNVKEIRIPSTSQGSRTKLRGIAILVLETAFEFNVYVGHVCLDFDIDENNRQLQSANMGQTFGWSSKADDSDDTQTLQALKPYYTGYRPCISTVAPELKEHITDGMFCGIKYNSTANCSWKGERGTGIAFGKMVKNVLQYYLRSIKITAPDINRECNDESLTVFTQIIKDKNLIVEALDKRLSDRLQSANNSETQEVTPGLCVLPPYPDSGTYRVFNKPHVIPGQAFPAVRLDVTCWEGYGATGSDVLYCQDGVWSQPFPSCVRYCKLEKNPSVNYFCLISGNIYGYRSCNVHEAPGTIVRPECNSPNYYTAFPLAFMTCKNGSWDYIATCIPECGRVTPEGWDLIVDGRVAQRGELPWHVAIFRKSKNGPQQICGGSLVTNTVVLSAAHCFWSGDSKRPASNYAVAIGKIYRAWDDERDQDVQKSEVKAIEVPPRFLGSQTNTQEDIAVLILVTPFVYQIHIRPVCLNFDNNFDRSQLQQGKLGKVAGWGLTTANGNLSEILKVVEMPYVTIGQCLATVPLSFREKITGDKICAGYTNGTALCRGDSGGGLAFPAPDREGRYFLRGIVSVSPTSTSDCNAYTLTAFTHVLRHEHFVAQYLKS